jgi:hypothetical protein
MHRAGCRKSSLVMLDKQDRVGLKGFALTFHSSVIDHIAHKPL